MNHLTVVHAVARRIARITLTNPAAAKEDYEQAVIIMSPAERATFDAIILAYVTGEAK